MQRNVPKPGVCVSCGTAIDLEYSTDAAKAFVEDLDRFASTKFFLLADCSISDKFLRSVS